MKVIVDKLTYPCDKIEQFVYDYIDGKLEGSVSLRFRMHIALCSQCREYVDLYKMTARPEDFREENPPHQELMDKTLDFLKKEGLLGEAEDKQEDPNQKKDEGSLGDMGNMGDKK